MIKVTVLVAALVACPLQARKDPKKGLTEQSWRTVAGVSFELAALRVLGKNAPIPGRFAFDAIVDKPGNGWWDGYAMRYERIVATLFTTHVGYTWLTDELPPVNSEQAGGTESVPERLRPRPQPWFTAGVGFERPLRDRWNIAGHIGAAYNNRFGLRWSLQLTTGGAFGKANRRLGIPRRTPNPFSH